MFFVYWTHALKISSRVPVVLERLPCIELQKLFALLNQLQESTFNLTDKIYVAELFLSRI